MPRRPRRARQPRRALTPRLCLALTIGPTPIRDDDLDDGLLREVWGEHRARLIASHPLDSMPWGFWASEPGVPDALRGRRPRLVEVDADDDQAAEDLDLDFLRAAWLDEHNGARSATNA